MHYKLYLDSYFLSNLVMDYFLLLLTGKLLQCTATHWRLLGGATVGAGLACFVILIPDVPTVIKMLLAQIIINFTMIFITFSLKKWKMVIRGAVYLYFFTFLLAGIMQWFQNNTMFLRRNKIQWFGFSVLGYIAVLFILKEMKKRKNSRENIFKEVHLSINGKKVQILGLVDTGNGLVEPISKKPVSIVSKNFLAQQEIIFPPENFRVIPYHSIGNGRGYLVGHEIEEMIICTQERDIIVKNAILGVSEENLSSKNGYEMILHHELLCNL